MSVGKVTWGVLYLIWFSMAGALFFGVLKEPRGGMKIPEELLTGVNIKGEATWMGIYLNNQKIGYIHSEIEPLDEGGYEIREFSRMGGTMLGTAQQMRLRMNVITDSALALLSFKGEIEADPYTSSFSGSVTESVLAIEVTTAGKTSEKFLPAPEPIYLSQAIKPLLQAGRLGDGDSLRLAGFDPMSLTMQDFIVKGSTPAAYRLWGEDVVARKLTTRLQGMESTVYVDDDGNTIAEFGPMGLVMRREPMEKALMLDDASGSSVDFLAIYAVKPIGEMRAPRVAERMRVKLSGINLESLNQVSDRQVILDAENGIVEVYNAPMPQLGSSLDISEFTKDAPFIESRERIIREAAERAVLHAKTLSDSVEKLNYWVFKAVKKKTAAGIPSALAVLNILQGDCNEHSVLFTALARSIGIPARIQLGVVYQQKRFYYHAWTAVWIEDRWVENDPTFGQIQADAARITLASGDMTDAIKLATVVGKLEIEILEEQ